MNDDSRYALPLNKDGNGHQSVGLRIYLLGEFRLQYGKKWLASEHINLHKARDLIKLIALAPNYWLHQEKLIEKLWPEQAIHCGAHNLSQTIYKLRPKLHELDPSVNLEFADKSLVLKAMGGISTDVEDFELAARSVLSHSDQINHRTAALCQEAIVRYIGDLLPEDGPSDLFYQRRDQLHQLYINLLLKLADYKLEIEEFLPAINTLQKVIATDPASEAAHSRLMHAFALNNQRQAALRQYQILEEKLRKDLDVEPSQKSQRLRDQIQSGELHPIQMSFKWQETMHRNLPEIISSFIGRDAEITNVRALVKTNRLVMLTGTGGIGKTRLALKVADNLFDEFPHGVYWAELASISNPKLVAKVVLDVFHLPDQKNQSEIDRLIDFLKKRRLLLLLDNCEHLITTCASLVETLLRSCPNLHILATSRLRLNLPGEITYYVPSLETPDPLQSIPLTEMTQYAAVRLFIERSSNFSNKFTLTESNASTVAHICKRLDGIPLAIELTAARSRMMTAEQIASQLNDAFQLLVGGSQTGLPRHQTLEASIDWSNNLLASKERLLLQRLSVFSADFGLEAVEAICSGEEILQNEVLNLLTNLVDQSLVVVETSIESEARYHLLETVRQYARARLIENEGTTKIFHRHLNYYSRFAQQADNEIRGPRQILWLKRIENEISNLTSAFERSLKSTSDIEMGVQLACALTWYQGMVGDFSMQRYFMLQVLSKISSFGRTATRASALFHAALSSVVGGGFLETQKEKALLKESLEIWQELDQEFILEEAKCLLTIGYIDKKDFNDDLGFKLMNKCIITFQKINNTWWHAWALNLMSKILILYEDEQIIRSILMEETILWRETGDRWGEVQPLMDWGQFALVHGKYVEAKDYLQRSLVLFQKLGSKGMAYQVMRDLSHTARELREFDQAEEYLENCIDLILEIGWNLLIPELDCIRGFLELQKGEHQKAQKLFINALESAQISKTKEFIILSIQCLSALLAVRKKPLDAISLFASCYIQKVANKTHDAMYKKFNFGHYLNICRTQIHKTAYDQAWSTGCEMTLEQAATYAQVNLE